MPINIYWDSDAQDIIRIDVSGDWTWQEYHDGNPVLLPMFLSVTHRVDIIADFREANSIANDPYAAQYVKRGRETRPRNYGVTVNVGASTIEKAIFISGTSISENRSRQVYFTDTIEKAYQIIRDERLKSG
jgi:hypothetical protein